MFEFIEEAFKSFENSFLMISFVPGCWRFPDIIREVDQGQNHSEAKYLRHCITEAFFKILCCEETCNQAWDCDFDIGFKINAWDCNKKNDPNQKKIPMIKNYNLIQFNRDSGSLNLRTLTEAVTWSVQPGLILKVIIQNA